MDEYKSVPSFHCVKLFRQGAKLTKYINRIIIISKVENQMQSIITSLTFLKGCDKIEHNILGAFAGGIDMIRIAIVDDDKLTCQEIERLLHTVCKKLMCRITTDVFYDGTDFIQSVTQFEQYDLVFMDIELIEMNGISAGTYLRNELHDQYTQIVFISGKQGYLQMLFEVRPMNFLDKPVTEAKLEKCISTYLSLFPENDAFRCKVGKAIRQQSYRSVLCFHSENKEIVVTTSNDEFRFIGKLDEVADIAPPFFWRTHKSYLINQNYIQMHQIDQITMSNGDRIPVSRHYQTEIRSKLMKLYASGGEEIFNESSNAF